METSTAFDVALPINRIVNAVQNGSEDLLKLYEQALQSAMFTNRFGVRPQMLGGIASDEVNVLISYLQTRQSSVGSNRGSQFSEIGLSDVSVMRLGRATRQFLQTRFEKEELFSGLELIDDYNHAVLQGFVHTREIVILNEQERIRSALQRTLGRYSLQMEVAASLAGATSSILNLDALVSTAVELIREKFDFYYVGLFLSDESGRWAIQKAGIGESGHQNHHLGQLIELTPNSLIGKCVESGEPRMIIDVVKENSIVRYPLLPETVSEAAIPLHSRGKIIGAFTAQSKQMGAFSDLDLMALRILADQLANAIENARLFSELRQSEEKYRTLMDNIEEGYYELDTDGRYTFANDALVYILDTPKNKILGSNFQYFVDKEYSDRVREAYNAAYQLGGAVHGIEFRIRSKVGLNRFVETTALINRNPMGEMAGLRGIVRDITARKQAEGDQIERKALERSNKELEQFASVASHDLQEPLRKIQTFGDQLKTKSGSLLDDEGRKYLDRMLGAADRSQVLINDLLSLSRIATQAQPFARVDLNKLLRGVVTDLEVRLEETGGRVEIEDLPVIEADATQMRQLFQNLIVNALKFRSSDKKPRIKISSRIIENKRLADVPGQPSSLCQVFVKDNGIGFDEKYLDRIFQPFQRLHSQQDYEGTGIGLSICRRIVERHGGDITAKSRPEHGATFMVTLPIKQAKGGDRR
jgi:two-component system, LuxR family, sensor kinase FixL